MEKENTCRFIRNFSENENIDIVCISKTSRKIHKRKLSSTITAYVVQIDTPSYLFGGDTNKTKKAYHNN